MAKTKLKKFDDNSVKNVNLLILTISFLTLFGCDGVQMTPDINPLYRWIGLVLITPKT